MDGPQRHLQTQCQYPSKIKTNPHGIHGGQQLTFQVLIHGSYKQKLIEFKAFQGQLSPFSRFYHEHEVENHM